jgi:hypothetical protein
MAKPPASPAAPLDDTTHEWVSFEDDDGDTFLFDLTFLTSAWTCIFGSGCIGVLTGPATELQQGCCSYGAHFQDADDANKVRDYAKRLTSQQWQFKKAAKKLGGPVFTNDEGETVSRLVDDACIFLNRPGFEGGIGCALHKAALDAGERPLDWKPNVCWQLPLRLEVEDQANGSTVYTVREWTRRDWGGGGEDFHWWCTDDPLAFRDHTKVYESLRDELVELVGDDLYDRLVAYIDRRGTQTMLPHPAVRRRTGPSS